MSCKGLRYPSAQCSDGGTTSVQDLGKPRPHCTGSVPTRDSIDYSLNALFFSTGSCCCLLIKLNQKIGKKYPLSGIRSCRPPRVNPNRHFRYRHLLTVQSPAVLPSFPRIRLLALAWDYHTLRGSAVLHMWSRLSDPDDHSRAL